MRRIGLLPLVCLALGCAGGIASAAAPVITSVDIDRTVRSNAPGVIVYDEKIVVRVSDADYTSNIAYVRVTDSEDPPDVVDLYTGQAITNTAASYTWTKRDLLTAPRAAPYTFQVWDLQGNTDALTTGTPPALGSFHMAVVAPVMDSVISQVQPTLQWQNPYASTEKTTRIDVYEEGQQSGVWFRNTTDGSTSALYGSGGTSYIGRTQLLANHSYVWTVRSGTNTAVYSMPGDSAGNHKVTVRDWQELHGRFTEYGAWSISPPSLPGKLAYGVESVATLTTGYWGVTGILEYGADPTVRTWIGPEYGTDPDWSPDGTKLLYATPSGLTVDDFTGGPPAPIPGTSGADAQCRWTADGAGILFRRGTYDASSDSTSYELWTMNADGTNAHALVATSVWEVVASPSPDGRWIAYDSSDGYGPAAVHIIAPDGSGDHVVSAAGVAGQDPAYTVTSLLQPAWSPDGLSLAVVFQADAPGLPTITGVGVMPAGGGTLTPVFIAPLAYLDPYSGPTLPAWSPEGTQIAFSSAHHRLDLWGYDPIWAVELWLVNADGSSPEPVRLTDDYSLDRSISWWRANTPAGSNVVFRRGDVTLTFETVTADGRSQIATLGTPADPAPPGFQFLPKSYQASTTAQYSGMITVAVSYQDSDIPAGWQEGTLVLLHWEGGQWANITSSLDTTGNVISGQCTSLGEFALALAAPPTADFAASPTSGVVPLTVAFTDASTGNPATWSWSFGDGGTSTEQNPSHTYTAAGTYSVTLTAANAAGSNTMTKAGYIAATIAPPVAAFSASPTSGVAPLMVAFADASTGGPLTWQWDFGDGSTSGEQNPTHTYVSPGSYTVSLTAANAGGATTCTQSDSITATRPAPLADFTAAPTSGLAPLTVQFSDASTGVVAGWNWDFGDGGTSGEQNPSHTFTGAGSYTVSLTVSNDGGADTCSKPNFVTVLPPPPAASFSASPTGGCAPLTVAFSDTSTGIVTSWLWDFGDGSTSVDQNPAHTYASVGNYTVSLTASNAGGATTSTVTNCVVTYQFAGPLAPIDPGGSSVFRKRPSVPVDFQLTDVSGAFVATADAQLFVASVVDGVVGSYVPAAGSKVTGNSFTYDPKKGIHDFPLDTGSMSAGVWSLRITVNGSIASEVEITLDKK